MANKDILTTYYERKQEFDKLEAEMKELKRELVEFLSKQPERKARTPFASFYVSSRKTWIYSPSTTELEIRLKEKQTNEQRTGVAKVAKEVTWPGMRKVKGRSTKTKVEVVKSRSVA